MWKAWGAVAIAVSSFALSLYIISICPAPLLPFAWAFSGTALTGVSSTPGPVHAEHSEAHCKLYCQAQPPTWAARPRTRAEAPTAPAALCLQWFVVGHDCGHRSFSKNKLVEDIVGTIMFMPLIYPFEPWRIKHNVHHAHTNKCAPLRLPRLPPPDLPWSS